MKKILALTLALMMIFALCACGDSAAPAASSAPEGETAAPAESSENPVVKIGVFEPQTGDNGAGGKQEILGM